MVRALEYFEEDFKELMSKYLEEKQMIDRDGDFPIEHDFYCLIDECEQFIKKFNKELED